MIKYEKETITNLLSEIKSAHKLLTTHHQKPHINPYNPSVSSSSNQVPAYSRTKRAYNLYSSEVYKSVVMMWKYGYYIVQRKVTRG
ncbi:MAG: hypothetical protein R6U91_07850 [Bacillota bacterium]